MALTNIPTLHFASDLSQIKQWCDNHRRVDQINSLVTKQKKLINEIKKVSTPQNNPSLQLIADIFDAIIKEPKLKRFQNILVNVMRKKFNNRQSFLDILIKAGFTKSKNNHNYLTFDIKRLNYIKTLHTLLEAPINEIRSTNIKQLIEYNELLRSKLKFFEDCVGKKHTERRSESWADKVKKEQNKSNNQIILNSSIKDLLTEGYKHETGDQKVSNAQLMGLYQKSIKNDIQFCGILPPDTEHLLQLLLSGCHQRMIIRKKDIKKEYEKMTRKEKIGEFISGPVLHHAEKKTRKDTTIIALTTIKALAPSKLPAKKTNTDYTDYDDDEKHVIVTGMKNKYKKQVILYDEFDMKGSNSTQSTPTTNIVDELASRITGMGAIIPIKFICEKVLDSSLKNIAHEMFKWPVNNVNDKLTIYGNGSIILLTVVLKECLKQTKLTGVYCDDPNDPTIFEFSRIPQSWRQTIPPEVKHGFTRSSAYRENPFASDDTYKLLKFLRNYIIYAMAKGFNSNSNLFGSMYQVYTSLRISYWPKLVWNLKRDLKLYTQSYIDKWNKYKYQNMNFAYSKRDLNDAMLILIKIKQLESNLSFAFRYIENRMQSGYHWAEFLEDTKQFSYEPLF